MTDPFQTLGVSPVFSLDLAELEARHRELSRALHPDRYTGRPASERRQALSRAIEVNEAFRTLRDPVRRAEAMLRRLGVSRSEGQEPKPDPSFLMDVMERREALSDARRRGDRAALEQLEAAARELEERQKRALSALFQQEPADTSAIERGLGELRYSRRFLEEAGAALDELG